MSLGRAGLLGSAKTRGSSEPIFSIAMDADHSFYVKTIKTHVRTFLPLNISAIGTVIVLLQLETPKLKSFHST